jgi:hypothetical protein
MIKFFRKIHQKLLTENLPCWQARGHRFDSGILHIKQKSCTSRTAFFYREMRKAIFSFQ